MEVNIQEWELELSSQTLSANRSGMMLDVYAENLFSSSGPLLFILLCIRQLFVSVNKALDSLPNIFPQKKTILSIGKQNFRKVWIAVDK